MEEHEVKILEVNRKEVEKKLIKLGAKKIFDGNLQTIFFDFNDKSILKNKKLVRLRSDGKKTVLCSKKPIEKNKTKIMEENEVEVSDINETKKILESIGLHPCLTMKKRRITYNLADTHFDFDSYIEDFSFIPEFLEIESSNSLDIIRFSKLLGFKEESLKSWTTKDLINFYKK